MLKSVSLTLLFICCSIILCTGQVNDGYPSGRVYTADQLGDKLSIQEIIHLKDADGKDYSVFWFYDREAVTLLLTSRDSIYYTVKNALVHPISSKGYQVRLSGCMDKGKADTSLIALVPIVLTDEPINAEAAWRIDLNKKQLMTVPHKKVTCPPLEMIEE